MTHPRHRPNLQNPPDPQLTPPGSPYASPPLSGGTSQSIERGTILSVDARRHAYQVALNSGRTVTAVRMLPSPSDNSLLPERTAVAVTFALGTPYILGVLPGSTAHTDVGPSLSGQDGHGGQDPAFDRGLPANGRGPNTPTDLVPGDSVHSAPGGASVGALRGGVATLSGGPLARVDAFGVDDRVRILAGLFRMDTWMGYQEVVNEEGRVSFRWKGGSDQVTQTGAEEERYTLHLDLGHEGDLVKFRVTTREQQDLFRVHISNAGRVELFAAGGVEAHGGDRDQAQHEQTHHGSHRNRVTRNATHNVGGHRTTHITENDRLEVDGAYEMAVTGFVNLVSADRFVIQSGGEIALNGVGRGRIGSAGLTISPGLTEEVLVDVTGSDRVRLGAGATSHAVKYEELIQVLTPIVNALNALRTSYATHVHPNAPLNPAYAQYAVPIQANFAPAKSLILRLL